LDAVTGEVLSGAAVPESAAPGLIESGMPTAAPPPSAPVAGSAAAPAAEQSVAQEVVQAAPKADPGLWQEVKVWAQKNPLLASAALQVGGSTLGGIASGAGQYMTAEKKAALELENKEKLTEWYRQHIQGSSVGGIGVRLGVKPKAGLVNRLMQ